MTGARSVDCVSFRSHARTVRDPAAALLGRQAALRRCVSEYAPYGFQATMRYLEERFEGLAERASLVAAVDELERSRTAWLAEVAGFGRRRREAKAHGQRRASRAEVAAYQEQGWPGDPGRNGPRVTERFLRRYGMTIWVPEPVDHRRRIRRLPRPRLRDGVLGTLGCGSLILVLLALAGWILLRPTATMWWAFFGIGIGTLVLLSVAAAAGDRVYRRLLDRENGLVVAAADRAEERWLSERDDTSTPG